MTESSATLLTFPARGEDRLRLALRGLEAALEAQAAAIAEWRGALGSLAGAVDGLDGSLGRYRAALDTTAEGLLRVGDEARKLERTAEGWAAPARA